MNTPFNANNAQPNLVGVAHSSNAMVPAGQVDIQPIDIDGKPNVHGTSWIVTIFLDILLKFLIHVAFS